MVRVTRPSAVFASPDEAPFAMRVGGLLAVLASLLGVVLAVGVSRWPAADSVPVLVLLGLMAAAGGLALHAPERMPPAVVVVSLVGGTAFVSAGMAIVGRDAVDGADNEMLFLIPLLYSAYFCRAWVTGLVTATAVATYGAVLFLLPVLMPAARWLTTSAVLGLVAVLVTATRGRDIRRIASAAAEAGHDPLTGLLNRRGLAARGAASVQGADVVSLLVVDIDHFKVVNDAYGHAAGDLVLVGVAEALRTGSRGVDVVARTGGEEFALVLPGCDAPEAVRRARSLCHRVAEQSKGWPAQVTLSVGTTTSHGAVTDVTRLLAAADGALYAAKAAGRNTVRSVDSTAPPPPRVPTQGAASLRDHDSPFDGRPARGDRRG